MSHQSKLKKIREYRVWTNIKTRCFNTKVSAYALYGGRGITICDRWRNSFELFLSDMGECPPGLTIERVNNDGNYEPGNCIWATQKRQCQNRRGLRKLEFNGELLTISEWGRRIGLSDGTIRTRLKLGWTIDQALDANLHHCKLTESDVVTIRQMLNVGATHEQIAALMRVDRSTITAISCGKNWKQDLELTGVTQQQTRENG